MKMPTILLMLLLTTQVVINSLAQEMPLVYDVENTGADYPAPYMYTLSELPSIQALPDPFKWADGRGRISNFSDWRYRREEIKYQIEHYEIGKKPDRPENITASFSEDSVLTVKVYLNGDSLILTSNVTLPAGDGPFPAIIGMAFGGTGSLPADIFTSRNIATIEYVHNQVTTYGNPQLTDPYYKLYPDQNLDNAGQYSAWAWGVSRLIDGLELVQDDCPIDLKHLAVTGCSYAGKMALFAGAFDERVALTIAQESGGGGAPAWRVSETLGNVEKLGSTDHNWFRESMFDFAGTNVPKLPEDHHELMAMCAPRALLVTGNTNYEWLANPSCYVSARATQEVYNALGVGDRFGFYIDGGHNHCAIPESQRPAIEAFVDKFLLGDNNADTDIRVSPYSTDLSPWITWTNPTLSNDSSYFGRTSLVYPPNLQNGVEDSVTFKWHRVEDADKYYFQLSTDPTFKTLAENDSLTDTLITVPDLPEGTRYYWRVQVKNIEGDLGPWSAYWNFVTYIPLPAMPELISTTTVQNRSNYIACMWKKVEYADIYRVQISRLLTFSPLAASGTTSDTVRTLSGLVEGQKYYWRVRAENIAGPGPWSDTLDFTIIVAPTDLALEISGPNEITLNWTDNSAVEDGYVIERKQSPDTIYTVLDTLKGSGNEYTDTNLEQGLTYTYRVKAYKDSAESDYSNEASLILVGIKEQQNEIPTKYSIDQNYPNPFNPTTKIKFALPKSAPTKIIIYDLLGREIQTLINKELEAGYHDIDLDASNLTSGIYFYRIQSGEFVSTKKMMLMK